jgi:hypothetical protein
MNKPVAGFQLSKEEKIDCYGILFHTFKSHCITEKLLEYR